MGICQNKNKMDREKIKKAVVELLKAIGEDPRRVELEKTPERVADMLENAISGKRKIPKDSLRVTRSLEHDEMVIVKNIPFYSFCEHHLLPFFGKCHVAYIPEGNRIVGISKIAEVADIMSKRLQVQERLTTEIANEIMKHLRPKGVGVVIEARHLCMEMQGRQPETEIVTSAVRGLFREDIKTREEFLKLIK